MTIYELNERRIKALDYVARAQHMGTNTSLEAARHRDVLIRWRDRKPYHADVDLPTLRARKAARTFADNILKHS